MKMKRFFVISIFAIFLLSDLFAVPADPRPKTIKQPNGKTLTFYIKGDERMSWAETLDGYTLLNGEDGVLEYACIDENGSLIPSGIMASNKEERNEDENNFLSQISPKLFYSEQQVEQMQKRYQRPLKAPEMKQ